MREVDTDILIVGSGMGGSTLAWALRNGTQRVLVAERGEHLVAGPENSDLSAVFIEGRYKNSEPWFNGETGAPFTPGMHYWVGGNSKVYGACLPRFRVSDFVATEHPGGMSPAWPFTYSDLEPHYGAAEQLYRVHGSPGPDPTEPPHSEDYPHPALEHEPMIQRLADSLSAQGLHPFRMANGIDLETLESRAACASCDGAPCETGAKSDAENRALEPALASGTVDLATGILITRLEVDAEGTTVTAAFGEQGGEAVVIRAKKFVLSAGAVNSAAILLRSVSPEHPNGLANSSGLVGRNYMVHNSTFMIAIDPRRINDTRWQKTLGLNDWYEAGAATPHPLGNLQMLGKLRAPMLKSARPWAPNWLLKWMSDHTIDLYLTSEDLPRRTNGVTVDGERLSIWWTRTNTGAHRALVRRARRAVRRAGYPLVFSQRMGIATNSHQCGTAVAGDDPATSVLDAQCRTHDVQNLWIVDSSFFPSAAALNPALTIAANALRVAPGIAAA